MRKISNNYLPIIILLSYLLCAPSLGVARQVSPSSGEMLSSAMLQKDRGMQLNDLPALAREKISKQLRMAEYEVLKSERKLPSGKVSTYRAFNRNQNLDAYFTNEGIHLLPRGKGEPAWHLKMTLSSYGYDGTMEYIQPMRSDEIKVSGKRVEYRRGMITEWYINEERGLEQGVTLNKPPVKKGESPLVVEWTVSGPLTPRMEQEGAVITFGKDKNSQVLHYSGLNAWDATGRPLKAKLAVRSGGRKGLVSKIAYLVDDSTATYPVTIDPVFTQVKKLLPAGSPEDHFGCSVSLSGDTVVVGAYLDDDNGSNSGSAYIFYRNQGGTDNWGQVTKLTAIDGAAGDWFGYFVSVSGDRVVVGAPLDDDNGLTSGSAYIFDRNQGGTDNWGQVTKLTASDGAAGDSFGYSVSLSGDTVVVGAYLDDDNGADSGSAYIFDRNQGGTDNWGEVAKITASDGAAGDRFGYSVSLSGDTVVVGARGDDDNGADSGSAYIFYRDQGGTDNWGEVAKITASDGAAYHRFGYSVSISGDTVVVGAYTDDDNGTASGSAYIFDRNQGGTDNWGEVAKITASDGAAGDRFGYSVSVSGDRVVVGAPLDDDNGADSGSAYIFSRDQGGADNWGEVAKLTASDGAADDEFGESVSLSGDTVVVGAHQDDDNGSDSGSAYIFDRDEGGTDNWGQVKKLTGSDGASGDIFGGSVSISGDTVVVGAYGDDDNGLASGSAYIFYRNQGGMDNWGQVTKLTASDAAYSDRFGESVSISGDTVVVGAYEDDDNGNNSGSAYIFYRDYGGTDNWGEAKKLLASDGAVGDFFGISVSLSGDTVVVGAYGDDDNGSRSGSAYIFYRNQGGTDNWGEVAKITASDGAADDFFGYSVSISSDTVVVGANDIGGGSGSAYVFERDFGGTDNWGEVAKITASDGAADDYFGYSVSLSGDTVVVGAYGNDDYGSWSGSAYIFYRNQGGADNWGEVKKLRASDAAASDQFGYSVSLSGDTLVVGSNSDNVYSGSAYIFCRDYAVADNWGQVEKLTASDGASGDRFGGSVSISGDTVVVGACQDYDNGLDSGSAYVFQQGEEEDTDGDGIYDSDDNCPATPNGSLLGTCVSCTDGSIGSTCTANEQCTDRYCSRYQEDYDRDNIGDVCDVDIAEDNRPPPSGNNCIDACECEGDFDNSGGVDGVDLATFNQDYNRGLYWDPCTNGDPCNGDVDCNGNVDGLDLAIFNQDYNRGAYYRPCPDCETDPWCVYP